MPNTLLDCYRAVEAESERMVEAARQQDWQQVARCQDRCALLIERLRERTQTQSLGAAQQQEKAHIMQRILRRDAEIRALAEPSLKRYESLFDASSLRVAGDEKVR